MSEFKIVRTDARANAYEAPDLFPSFYRYGKKSRRSYLEKELVALAVAKTLYVTDLMNQSTEIKDLAGQIILGHAVIDHQFRGGIRVPTELLDYRVHVKSLTGGSVRWCRDMVEGAAIGGRRPGTGSFREGPPGGEDVAVTYHRVTEEWVDTEQPDVMLRLQDAWLCLKAGGAHCVTAKRAAVQAKVWKYEEVRPEPVTPTAPVPTEPAPSTSKRRGGFAEVNG